MGGKTDKQTLTGEVGTLTTRDLNRSNALRFIGKELLVGLANGSMFALLAGTAAWLWFGQPMIGVIIGVAMVINLMVAALAGALVPLGLEKLGVAPAGAPGALGQTPHTLLAFL